MESGRERLDELDKQILDILQRGHDATPNVTSIAKKLSKPTATVHSRIKRLEKREVIKGYRAVFEQTKLKKGRTLFLLVTTVSSPEGGAEPTVNKWLDIPEVKEIHYTSGDFYFILKVRVKSLDDMYELEERIWNDSMKFVKTIVVLKSFKEETSHLVDF